MKKQIVFLIVFVFLFILIFSVLSKISISNNLDYLDFDKISEQVYEKLTSEDKINITIYYNNDDFKKEIKQKAKILYEAETFDAVSAEVDKETLEKLISNPDVSKIETLPEVKIFLNDSVLLINATSTWQIRVNETNLTGTGETICILDTGVNYLHADLGGCYGNNNASSSCKVIGGYDFINGDSDPIDDHGHGTHLAGIAAANGTLKGVAPDSKIIAIKVCSSSGSCDSNAVTDGINWCVNNASTFNITVISMSFGTTNLYSNYCDSTFSYWRDAINAAVAKNISVFSATGNSGNTTSIAAPACIENVTSVAATTKADAIYNYNRNNITDIVAPGVSINSTWGLGYSVSSGTSIATPHISGAAALIYQYMHLSGRNITPAQLYSAMNSTGKQVNDSETGLNFSRVNIYSAINYFAPSIIWINTTPLVYPGQNISIEAKVLGANIVRVWYNITNSSNVVSNNLINQTQTITDYYNSSYNVSELNLGTYNLTVYAKNSYNDIVNLTTNFTVSQQANLTLNIITQNGTQVNSTVELINSAYVLVSINYNETTNQTLASGLYDIKIKDTKYYVFLNSTNLSGQSNITVIFENISTSSLPLLSYGAFRNYAFVLNHTSNLTNLTTICFNNTGISFQNQSNLKIAKCSWNVSSQTYTSSLATLASLVDTTKNTTCTNTSGLSAFVLIEQPCCGDSVCSSSEGETCSNCNDCACSTGYTCNNGNCEKVSDSSIGGGGGRDGRIFCKENWLCTNWSGCVNRKETRFCQDTNYCGTTSNKPETERECGCEENWECNDWSTCIEGEQTRKCYDKNSCGTFEKKPTEEQICIETFKKETQKSIQFEIIKLKKYFYYLMSFTGVVFIIIIVLYFLLREKIEEKIIEKRDKKHYKFERKIKKEKR